MVITSFKVLFFLLLFSYYILFPTNVASVNIPDSERLAFDTIFQFGDSLSDTGNLVLENPYGAHSFASFPYGQTIHHPTGRCSDGLLIIDYIANVFHLPLLSPFLDRQGNFDHGVNFAVAGSTALDTATLRAKNIVFSPPTNSSLSVQLSWFKYHLNSMCTNRLECEKKVSKSLFVIETGGNDYNYAFLHGKTMKEVKELVPEVVGAIKEAVNEVIRCGAIRVVVAGNLPIGCLPVYLTAFESRDRTQYDELKCLKEMNAFAMYHNDLLQQAIRELQMEHPDNVAIVYGDYYSALRWILQNAAALGFDEDNVLKACCGSSNNAYNFDLKRMCGAKEAQVCANPTRLVSWDGIHLTQRAYLRMAQRLLQQIVPKILEVV
ncbi:acetylajmalan esterase-like [Chenopodium quinoa]|uniref:Uncharacterized protein n=1 Tax=Chenopodium quinoa TaxID=63459 RepID=A0A803KZ33_CHEQI|nr:acetylajmalan esterase-like [Chenopodium quinoa]